MWIKGTLRQASVLEAMALAAALTLVGLVPTAAHAATGCRTIPPSISGAYFQGTI